MLEKSRLGNWDFFRYRRKKSEPFRGKNVLRQYFQVYHLNSEETGAFTELM